MQYETFLFTRNQRQDFTAFVRPSLMSNKDVSAIGAIFNCTADFAPHAGIPSLTLSRLRIRSCCASTTVGAGTRGGRLP